MPHVMAMDWAPPPKGRVKVDFDGSSFGNSGPAGFGCVMRDSQGSILIAKGNSIGWSDANHVELIGLLEGWRMLKHKGYMDCIVEGDSKTVISWGR